MFSNKIARDKAINLVFLLLLTGGVVLILHTARMSEVDAFSLPLLSTYRVLYEA